MGVETRDRDARMFYAEREAGVICDVDAFVNALLFHQIAGLPQRYVRGDMHYTELFIRQHHGVILGVGEFGVNFGMTVVMIAGQIHSFLVEGACDRAVNLVGHRQLNDFAHTGEGRLAANYSDLTVRDLINILAGQRHLVHVERTGLEQRVRNLLHRMNRQSLCADSARTPLNDPAVADDDRVADIIGLGS